MRIKYFALKLSQLSLEMGTDGNSKVARISFPALGGGFAVASERFWRGVKTTLKVSDTMLHYFEGHEILAQAVVVHGDMRVMLCVEENEVDSSFRLLGVSQHENFKFSSEDAIRWLRNESAQANYCDGVLTSQCNVGRQQIENGQVVSCLYEVALSIDGVGRHKTSVVLTIDDWRMVLTSAFFSSTIAIEGGLSQAITRNKASIGKHSVTANVVAARRLSDAESACVSLNECSRVMILLERLGLESALFDEAMGHPFEAYGLASVSALPAMRMGKLPVNRTVREMLAALARLSHSAPFPVRERVGRFAADLLENLYDFENMTFESVMDFEELPVSKPVKTAKIRTSKPTKIKNRDLHIDD